MGHRSYLTALRGQGLFNFLSHFVPFCAVSYLTIESGWHRMAHRCATSQIGNGPEGGPKWPALGHGRQEGQRPLRLCPRSLSQRRRAGPLENYGSDVYSLISRGQCHGAALCFQGNPVLPQAGSPGASRIPGDFMMAASPGAKLAAPALAGNSTSPMLKCNRPVQWWKMGVARSWARSTAGQVSRPQRGGRPKPFLQEHV